MSQHRSALVRSLTLSLGLLAALPLGLAAESATPATRPRLVDLGADKCIPCKLMMPVLAEMTQEYAGRLDVVFIDVWKDRSKGQAYGIQVIPTQIFFDAAGKEIYRHEGFIAKKDILAKWAELGVKFPPPAKGT